MPIESEALSHGAPNVPRARLSAVVAPASRRARSSALSRASLPVIARSPSSTARRALPAPTLLAALVGVLSRSRASRRWLLARVARRSSSCDERELVRAAQPAPRGARARSVGARSAGTCRSPSRASRSGCARAVASTTGPRAADPRAARRRRRGVASGRRRDGAAHPMVVYAHARRGRHVGAGITPRQVPCCFALLPTACSSTRISTSPTAGSRASTTCSGSALAAHLRRLLGHGHDLPRALRERVARPRGGGRAWSRPASHPRARRGCDRAAEIACAVGSTTWESRCSAGPRFLP